MRGRTAPFSFVFKKDEQGWRFSLLPLLAVGEPALKQMAKQSGQGRERVPSRDRRKGVRPARRGHRLGAPHPGADEGEEKQIAAAMRQG